MPRARNKRSKPDKTFAVGDHVLIRFPASTITAEIIEDRGRLGVGGRQIFRVRTTDTAPSEPTSFEVPAEDLLPRVTATTARS